MSKVGSAKYPGSISAQVMRHQITCQGDVQPTHARVKNSAWGTHVIDVFPRNQQQVVLSWAFV